MQSLNLKKSSSTLTLFPERWGIITSLKFWDIEVLYQDKLDETLYDTSKNVRGGIPILFPQAGPISPEVAETLWYSIPQHGVVRQRTWEVLNCEHDSCSLNYTQSQEETEFPYAFSLKNDISLKVNALILNFTLKNLGKDAFPYSYGYHPYFAIPQWDKDAIIWDTRYANEIVAQKDCWQHDGTLSLDTQDGYFNFEIPSIGKLRLSFSPEIKKIWIWSLSGQNFVCVEPVVWDEWNLTREAPMLSPGEETSFFFEIQRV